MVGKSELIPGALISKDVPGHTCAYTHIQILLKTFPINKFLLAVGYIWNRNSLPWRVATGATLAPGLRGATCFPLARTLTLDRSEPLSTRCKQLHMAVLFCVPGGILIECQLSLY